MKPCSVSFICGKLSRFDDRVERLLASARQLHYKTIEGRHVGDRGSVPGEDQAWAQLGQPVDRAAVLGPVGGEVLRRLPKTTAGADERDVSDYVATDCHPIGLAPEDHLSCRMSGCMQNLESAHLIALFKHPLDSVGRPLPKPGEELGKRMIGCCHRASSLHRIDVVAVAGEGNAALLTDCLGGALVVGVDVGECQQGNFAVRDLLLEIRPRSQRRPASMRTFPAR